MSLHKLMHNPAAAWLRKPANAELAKVLLRLAIGAVFMAHGWQKLTGLEGTTMFFNKLGIPFPQLMAPFIGCVEFFGGAAMILGLAARLAGFLLACTMVVAIITAKGFSSWFTMELEVTLLAANLCILLSGAGGWSIDAKLMRKGSAEHAAAMPMAAPKA